MQPDIRWIKPTYGAPIPDGDKLTQIEVPEMARATLKEMARELVGTNGLVALYVPLGTEDVYSPGVMRGRIICAVELLAMPPDKKLEDFFSTDWDGSRRWPIGWPARLIYSPPVAECPFLKEHVESLFGSGSFSSYAARLHVGPFRLEQAMRDRLNADYRSLGRSTWIL